jgi:hypothetical protein
MWVPGDIDSGNLEENQLSGLGLRSGIAAKIACGNAGVANLGDRVIGIKLSSRTAVGIHIRNAGVSARRSTNAAARASVLNLSLMRALAVSDKYAFLAIPYLICNGGG